MAPLNKYHTPEPLKEELYFQTTPAEEYDVNFCFNPVPEVLSSEGVKLVPLVPSLHYKALLSIVSQEKYSSVYNYLPYSQPKNDAQLLTFLETLRRDTTTLLFTIFDQSLIIPATSSSEDDSLSPQRICGLLGLLKSSAPHNLSEIGHITIPPPFQRSHIATHACGLLLKYCFNTLTLRRVQWFANDLNLPSVNAAKRLGLSHEGLLMWDRTLPLGSIMARPLPDSVQGDLREAEEKKGGGRHSAVLAEDWDTWRKSGEKHLDALMARKVEKRGLDTIKW